MATIGVYDADYMNYNQVIPNLECAKLCAYYKSHNQIAVLTPYLQPDRYTNFFVRKEYDDGSYPKQYFDDNVSYGGRAFTPDGYVPLDTAIEYTTPDMLAYERYRENYSNTNKGLAEFGRIINSINVRLSLDGKECNERILRDTFDKAIDNRRGIVIHDYFPDQIKDFREIVSELSNTHYTKEGKPKPLAIGNKYPIQVCSSEELSRWADIYPMSGVFFLKFCGLMDNEVLYEMIQKNPQFCRQIYYNVDYGCSSENDFLEHRAIEIFKQVLFCRYSNTRILLKYRDGFFKTPELEKFITLMNCFANQKWQEGFMANTQTLYNYCSQRLQRLYRDILRRANVINQYDMREIFQYIRIHNYELFKMFYEWDKVYFEGGEFKNEWTRD